MKNSRMRRGFLMIALWLSACAPAAGGPSAGVAAVRAWFDAPLPGTVFYPPNPCQIVAHGSSPSGIALFELTINGAAASTIPSPDTKSSLATLTRDCGLSQPGEYNLMLRAQDNAGNWSGYAETSLVIDAGAIPNQPVQPPPQQVIASPTPTPVPAVPGEVSVQSVSTWLLYAGDAGCGPQEVSIVAHATAPKGIKVVVLFYRFEPGSPSGFADVAMSPLGGDLYQGVLNPTSVLGGPAGAILQYQVVVQQNDGDTSIRTPVLADIEVKPCGGGAPPPVDCSSFPDKRACEANGCSWVAGPGIVPVYSCQNP